MRHIPVNAWGTEAMALVDRLPRGQAREPALG